MIARRGLMIGAALGLTAWSSMAPAQPADQAALLGTLMELEKASWQYVKDRNLAGMQNYLADDGLLIFGDGSRYTKAEFLKAIPDFRLDSLTIDPKAEVKIWSPDVATLLYRITYASAMKDDKAVTLKVTSASTYARRNDKWWSVLYQETPTP
jgi:Domain of unknown function (DUF4440)